MQYILMALFAIIVLAADQIVKFWSVHNLSLPAQYADLWPLLKDAFHIPALSTDQLPAEIKGIPGLFKFSLHLNDGAAWSSFRGMHWLFILVFVVFADFLVWEFATKRFGFAAFERWCLVAIFAGGLGNLIDRLRLGYVVDMIAVEFIDFPVFNVADCFITCGCIALIVHLFFFNKAFWKDGKK